MGYFYWNPDSIASYIILIVIPLETHLCKLSTARLHFKVYGNDLSGLCTNMAVKNWLIFSVNGFFRVLAVSGDKN